MKLIDKVAYTAHIIAAALTTTLVIAVIVGLTFLFLQDPSSEDYSPDMGGLCMSLCKKEYGHHITKAIPVNGGGCYCYP